jgi:hypothetical protein
LAELVDAIDSGSISNFRSGSKERLIPDENLRAFAREQGDVPRSRVDTGTEIPVLALGYGSGHPA